MATQRNEKVSFYSKENNEGTSQRSHSWLSLILIIFKKGDENKENTYGSASLQMYTLPSSVREVSLPSCSNVFFLVSSAFKCPLANWSTNIKMTTFLGLWGMFRGMSFLWGFDFNQCHVSKANPTAVLIYFKKAHYLLVTKRSQGMQPLLFST